MTVSYYCEIATGQSGKCIASSGNSNYRWILHLSFWLCRMENFPNLNSLHPMRRQENVCISLPWIYIFLRHGVKTRQIKIVHKIHADIYIPGNHTQFLWTAQIWKFYKYQKSCFNVFVIREYILLDVFFTL